MATGYSSKFIHAVSTADKVKLGVKFGLICIQKDIPVADIADYFKVSRMTVYNWFKGVTAMPEKHEGAVAKLSGWIT
jgi:hypothetical protein